MRGPFRHNVCYPNRLIVPVNARVGILEVQMLGDNAMPHGQDGLNQPGDAGRWPQMADVGLDRTHQHRAFWVASLAEDLGGGIHLDGVADDGAGAVSFQVVYFVRSDPGAGQGFGDCPFLGRGRWAPSAPGWPRPD